MMEKSEAVTYTQGGAQRDETGNDKDVYTHTTDVQHVPEETDDTGLLEPVRHGLHDTPTTIQHSSLELQTPVDQPVTTGLAKQKKLLVICAILLIVAFGVGLAVGSTLLYHAVDECASNPRATGAVCFDGVGRYTCICNGTVTHRDCEEIRNAMCSVSDVYTVTPRGGTPTQVYCDMDTDGGGWLVFQKRVDGSLDFYLNWTSYAAGFGDLNGEFWLGNRNLHLLTAQKNYTLRVVLSDWEGNHAYAQYINFTIDSEQDKFRLNFGNYSGGDAGDSLFYNKGMQFSTPDEDKDQCAQVLSGAWWHSACSLANLNGHYYPRGPYRYLPSQTGFMDGVEWYPWKGDWYSFKSTRMMIRPAP